MKTPDDRWQAIEAMPPDEWQAIAARVSVCLTCRGPALLSDEQLGLLIAEPMCTRCRSVLEAVGAEAAS